MPSPTSTQLSTFRKKILAHYKSNRRSFPWREGLDALTERDRLYRIIVSEIMLQQTQAPRVVPKYESFLKKFPDFETLAKASKNEVLLEWQGLGYNRRGMYVKKIAEKIVTLASTDPLPRSAEVLVELPGIGPNTAGSILAFAYNITHPFIETNIRSVYIHFFFGHEDRKISDVEILPLVEKTLDRKNPREWYFALMDYGVMLKAAAKSSTRNAAGGFTDPARKSKMYKKQSKFKGSNRELRASILRATLAGHTIKKIMRNQRHHPSAAIKRNIEAMKKEGLL